VQKYRPYLLLGAAILTALIPSVLAYHWLQRNAQTMKEAGGDTRMVAVAEVDLPWGTVLKMEMVRTVSFLKESLPEGNYFSDSSSLNGKVVISPVKANEPVFRSRLAPENVTTGGVSAVVNPNKRAMAVKVDKVIGVSGFVHPGNRVDVLVTIDKAEKSSEPVTKIVLQNILVLAAGVELETKGAGEKPAQVDVITLEVTPEEAEKLALSTAEGKIQLALRNLTDTGDVFTKGTTIPMLLAMYSPAPATKITVQKTAPSRKASEKAVSTAKPSLKVEVIKGDSLRVLQFKGGE